ncbi:hypothetical protein RRG08_026101 [Elysia crispata]|uniref:Uncharacterized protein n=1 Tax=Elysia crispata TaxID=231223 RepID=A0AAE0YSK2_9GAST|nr:hypothetical protein RRG08_026101 [Elysia crispata]
MVNITGCRAGVFKHTQNGRVNISRVAALLSCRQRTRAQASTRPPGGTGVDGGNSIKVVVNTLGALGDEARLHGDTVRRDEARSQKKAQE